MPTLPLLSRRRLTARAKGTTASELRGLPRLAAPTSDSIAMLYVAAGVARGPAGDARLLEQLSKVGIVSLRFSAGLM